MALDSNLSHLSDTAKELLNAIPFVAAMVTDVETPYYTKLLQAVITASVIGFLGWGASVIISNKDTGGRVLSKLDLVDQRLVWMQDQVLKNSAEIEALKGSTKERVFRPEWERKYIEQDARLLHLERAVR